MVLSAALMTKTKNKCSVYFQGVTVNYILKKLSLVLCKIFENQAGFSVTY